FRVLMVDDDRTILELYGGQLRGAGFQVYSLSDPWAVLEVAVEFQPELILLDLYMPEVDGFEISHLLRQEERFLNIPIVFLSGERDVHKQVKAFDVGAFDFLVKPVKPGQLVELVRARAAQYRRLADKVQYLGKTDPVTGLYNRHYFTTLLGEQLQQPARGNIRALLFMELDRMPQFDASSGEVESLNLLRTKIARMITEQLIPGDLAAAYSEGVFVVLAERVDLAALEALAEALRRGVEVTRVRFRDGTLDPCASIGLARAGDHPRRAISDAALACSMARLAGGNTVRLQDDLKGNAQDQEQRQYWMKQIGDAVKDQRLFLVYQPIASLMAESKERFEVLLRIRDEAGQTVLPGQFMQMARQLGLIRLLDRWVVSQALGNLALQQQTKSHTTFFIKLSTETLLEGGFLDWLTKIIQHHKIRPGSCIFEFPEADLRSHPAVNHSLIKRLQAMNIGLAVEHFSGSQSALEMLDALPVNYVKLDRKLVHRLPDSPDQQKVVRQIIDKARTKGILTVAAYVEDAASLSLLWQNKIDLIQGFFLQQPHEVARYDIAI
ncbi:MAG: EAL domain-containing protein, partial [Candidatus Competibacteraceae bacterium]|nr:EAL domain-containing protein [Candidatus Competibacteraceae bacterium]